MVFGVAIAVGEQVAGGWTGAIAATPIALFFATRAGASSLVGVAILCGLMWTWLQPLLFYPVVAVWNGLLYRADHRRSSKRPSLLRWHSAFWDENQRLPLLGLDSHIVLIAEKNADEGELALDYISGTHQRWAAVAAQLALDAHRLEACTDVAAIGAVYRVLRNTGTSAPASSAGNLLRGFIYISQDIAVALTQQTTYNRRLSLQTGKGALDRLKQELARSSSRYASRLLPIATRWRDIVADQIEDLAREVEVRQEVDNPYICGLPLRQDDEIFTGRTDIGARIEQLLADRRRPPLLLYGQRRMGKTSLLNNLGRLLPNRIVPLFVDLQRVAAADDAAGFLSGLARSASDWAEHTRGISLPKVKIESLREDPFTGFNTWLDQVESQLGERTGLLELDEFEALEDACARGRLDPQQVFGTLRHLYQHRRFKVLLAGAHTPDELEQWSTYLIDVQMIRISYLREDEARRLIEEPVKDVGLLYEPLATQRILELTRGHPFLVQLLCQEIVTLKNEQALAQRRLVHRDDVEASIAQALQVHENYFRYQRSQFDENAQKVLRHIATLGPHAVASHGALLSIFGDQLDAALNRLLRRDLLEECDEGYRFQVELVRRYLALAPI
jgi:hypothetical protein